MATTVWKGHLTFGLISIPVRLYAAARGERISFNQLHNVCHSRLKQPLFCPTHKRIVDRSEVVKGYDATGYFGFGAPKGTPRQIVDKLNTEINAGLADPKLKARFADLGSDVLALSPADFGKFIVDETEKWGNVIRALNIKAQ